MSGKAKSSEKRRTPVASAKAGGSRTAVARPASVVKTKGRVPVVSKKPVRTSAAASPKSLTTKGKGKAVATTRVKTNPDKVAEKSAAEKNSAEKNSAEKTVVAKAGSAKVPATTSASSSKSASVASKPVAPTLKPAAMGVPAAGIKAQVTASVPVPAVPARVPVVPTQTGTNTITTLCATEVNPQSPYGKALKYLATLSDYEHRRIVRYNPENFNLDRMRALLKRVGDPHTKFRSVHVAGTKGKGSTCAMIASMLQANGYKTASYSSPHLVDIRERIAINGEMISRDDFARLVKTIEPHVAKVKPLPTYFDVLTAVAFMYYAEQKVDLAVVETGLGGRLDSTNVVTPEVTAITSISFDHMAQLGPTLEKIAAEKAGIFKPGVPAVTCTQTDGVEAVLKQHAEAVGAPFDICGKTIEFSYRFESSRLAGPHFRLCLTTPTSKFEHLQVPMVGEHQAVNCGLALSVMDKLKSRGIALSDSRCLEGLQKTTVPGRMEFISQTPRIIVDGAHNASSIDALIKSVGQHVPYDSMVLIFGCCNDKDVKGMLEKIAGGADKVIFTRVNNIRTAEPEDLAHKYNEMFGKMCQVAPTLEAAMSIARRAISKEDLICITGSFYLVGEAKRLFTKPAPVPTATTPAIPGIVTVES